MGNHSAEAVQDLPSAQTIKVHAQMCSELLTFVIRVSKIFPEIEAARPRCTSGIEALCLLNNGVVKAKSLLQQCSESSVLYLALTGEAILSRCKKSKYLLYQSLSQIKNMVPVLLAAKISGIVDDLRSAAFDLDPSTEEAGRILRELLHGYGSTVDSTEETAVAAICYVSSLLHISSQKTLLVEKRSVKRMLDRIGDSDPSKRKILLFFLKHLSKYGKIMATEQKDNISSENEAPLPFSRPYRLSSNEVDLRADYRSNKAQIDIFSSPVPPEEFICPLSSRLMYDPVVIASGLTYERMWIQRWFDEGHVTCPKTNVKLVHLSFTSNTSMKDLIMKWCNMHRVSIPDPKVQEELVRSLEFSSNSIVSLTSSMNDLNLPLDYSNISLGSSHGSDLSFARSDVKSTHEVDMAFLSKFSTLPWDSQCNAVEDVKRLLKQNDESWLVIPSEKFIQLILRFLKDAHDFHHMEAQMTGCLLLLEFVQKHGNSVSYMKEDDYHVLASLLDTEVSKQALSILETMSFHKHCGRKIAASGALVGIFNILDGQIPELLELALKILRNISSDGDVRSFIDPHELIPKLIPLSDDNTLARYCITILKNLCNYEEARRCVAETEGCIRLIVTLLESENHEDQEHAASVLVSLCSQHVHCQLMMEEGVIPGLVSVSVNGNKKAKAMAMEVLRILKDEFNTVDEYSGADVSIDSAAKRGDDKNPPKESKRGDDKNPPKVSGLFTKFFSKPGGKSRK
ncbi:hypothetical protein ACS0TY_008519 [Phlomoides rotata]